MARTVLSLALLACLGLAFLHLVSAEEQNQELEEKATNIAATHANSDEQQIRIAREADAEARRKRGREGKNGNGKNNGGKAEKNKKCKNGKNCKKGRRASKKCKKGPEGKECRQERKRKGRSKSKECKRGKKGKKCRQEIKRQGRSNRIKCNKGNQGKKCRKRQAQKSKKRGRNGGKHGQKRTGKKVKKTEKIKKAEGRQAACDTEALCQKIKDYIKYSNQLRKLRRINKTCSTMEKKRDKAGGGEFSASGEANDASDNSTVQEISDKLKNCTTTAKAKCETKAIPACTNLTLNNKCETELDAWIKKFGPAKGSCLQASASCCACITAISPAPSADCLNFDPLDIASKAKKKKCTGSSEEGSFGHCRKLQMEAAEKGPKAHKEKCKGKGDMTTAKSSGRRNIFRSNLMKKFIKT